MFGVLTINHGDLYFKPWTDLMLFSLPFFVYVSVHVVDSPGQDLLADRAGVSTFPICCVLLSFRGPHWLFLAANEIYHWGLCLLSSGTTMCLSLYPQQGLIQCRTKQAS